jgi:hypothetical protein
MIKKYVDDYGFPCLDIRALSGGSISVTHYRNNLTDIGLISINNGVGLGGSNYIRTVEDFQQHFDSVHRIVWLNDEEKQAVLAFFTEMESLTKDMIKVRERFMVKKAYNDGKIDYTFSDITDLGFTLHTKLEITVSIPSNWSVDNAWSALFDILNPKQLSTDERFSLER